MTERKIPSKKTIYKSLFLGSRSAEYVIDRLTDYRLANINEVISRVVQLAKEGAISFKKTKKGFSYTVNKYKDEEEDKSQKHS